MHVISGISLNSYESSTYGIKLTNLAHLSIALLSSALQTSSGGLIGVKNLGINTDFPSMFSKNTLAIL